MKLIELLTGVNEMVSFSFLMKCTEEFGLKQNRELRYEVRIKKQLLSSTLFQKLGLPVAFAWELSSREMNISWKKLIVLVRRD
jgi:hypothetical protein